MTPLFILSTGGSETTSAALSSFFLVMTLYPDIQRKAQEEIDQVVGHERLPTFDDRQKLPFVECILREIYRWATPSNMGVTHRLMEDDVYEGYFIPAGKKYLHSSAERLLTSFVPGTAILTNIWYSRVHRTTSRCGTDHYTQGDATRC